MTELLSLYITLVCVGLLFGVIRVYNSKLYFSVWVGVVLVAVVTGMVRIGQGTSLPSYEVVEFVVGVGGVAMGMVVGEHMYKKEIGSK